MLRVLSLHCVTADSDGDGYGDSTQTAPADAGSDCDDASDVTFPGAAELDSTTDCMKDEDDDGYGDESNSMLYTAGSDCDDSDDLLTSYDGDGDGYSTCDGDCNDSDDSIHPFAPDPIDGVDRIRMVKMMILI